MAPKPAGTTPDAPIVIDSDTEDHRARSPASTLSDDEDHADTAALASDEDPGSDAPYYLSDDPDFSEQEVDDNAVLAWAHPLRIHNAGRKRLKKVLDPLIDAIRNKSSPYVAGLFTKKLRCEIIKVLQSWMGVIELIDDEDSSGRYEEWTNFVAGRHECKSPDTLETFRRAFQIVHDILLQEHAVARPIVAKWIALYPGFIHASRRRQQRNKSKGQDEQ